MTAIDLRTRYLELDLPHPVVASASPLTRSVEGICQLADAGAAAVVMASIYEEQIVAAELAELALLEADGADALAKVLQCCPNAVHGASGICSLIDSC